MTRTILNCGVVVSMDAEIGVLRNADIVIDDGRIEAVGQNVGADEEGSDVIDLSDAIVLPGLVNAHAHLFQTSIRGIAGDYSLDDYYHNVKQRLRPAYTPEDVYLGDLFGAFEQLNAGVTTVFDWCHVINTPAHADRAVDALIDSGIRAVFGYGVGVNQDSSDPHPEDARRMAEERLPADDGRVSQALSLRRPSQSSYEIATQDLRFARELGLPASMHIGAAFYEDGANEEITAMHEEGLLGPDVNFVHANDLSEEVFNLMGSESVSVSVTPEAEMQMGHGLPATGKALKGSARLTLGSDVVSSVGSDMFTPMRIALQTQRALDNVETLAAGESIEELSVSLRDVLRAATIDGARALGVGDDVGSLTPGKQADITAISTESINTGPVRDPIATIVLHAEPANVDTVLVRGEPAKLDGELVHPDVEQRWDDMVESGDRLLRDAGLEELATYS